MRRRLIAIVTFFVLAAACGGDGAVPSSSSAVPSTTPQGTQSAQGPAGLTLLTGSIEVPGARAFGDPGFHEPFVLIGTIPQSAAGLTGELVVRLRDAGRPDQTCDRNHPLSGCVTIDWSDFEDRPGVPAGGVFDNRLQVVSAGGSVDLFLSERRGLAATPDQYSPT